jgi:hypothetical protein
MTFFIPTGFCVRTCRSRLLGLAKVLSHRVQACVRLPCLASFTMATGFLCEAALFL